VKCVSKTDKNNSRPRVPYILEFEPLALGVLRNEDGTKEDLKELLERYAAKYAKERPSRV